MLEALDGRRLYRESAGGSVPPPLREAIHGFRQELAAVERRLQLLGQ